MRINKESKVLTHIAIDRIEEIHFCRGNPDGIVLSEELQAYQEASVEAIRAKMKVRWTTTPRLHEDLLAFTLCRLACVDWEAVIQGYLEEGDFDNLIKAAREMAESDIKVIVTNEE